jgi:hypothetical protein
MPRFHALLIALLATTATDATTIQLEPSVINVRGLDPSATLHSDDDILVGPVSSSQSVTGDSLTSTTNYEVTHNSLTFRFEHARPGSYIASPNPAGRSTLRWTSPSRTRSRADTKRRITRRTPATSSSTPTYAMPTWGAFTSTISRSAATRSTSPCR